MVLCLRMTGRKKYKPKVVDTSEKMKRKKSCNDPPSSSLKKKCNHPSSMDPTIDPTSTNPTVNHPPSSSNTNPSSSNPICNEEISFFNKDYKQWYENYINYRPLLLERGVLLDQLKEGMKDRRQCLPFPILISKIMEDCGVVVHSSNTYSTPMNPIYGGTIKKSLAQGQKNTT
ncbi:unnamed protein product [Ilex paraguariensis]|uniref:Uncharacterized protein n=1 Tax=Ilex paraguariensis TaxID=185542 RepID=A0ABC8RZ05_9AQUA